MPHRPGADSIEELGRAVSSAFVCDRMADAAPRREIREGLQVVEDRNSEQGPLHGTDGDVAGADEESQEVSMVALQLHLLRSALVHASTRC
ncbi:Tn3 family transposase [Streptomyces sp. NPDC053367]|uniref:Tn3 family transposase n=1 Tax=Streptomyces sp. NPDC053367 TaxID=3365700 RepID=UPI0037CD7A27